jgi:hypothetical protein
MYRKNEKHLQLPLMSSLDELPEKRRQQLEESWAGTFYQEFFTLLDEEPFAILYSENASRPNVPVNVLVGLEVMKSGFGWSDEEMYEAYCYNLQVRYALGIRNLDEGDFELRTIYNFRRRLVEHMRETGKNLLEQAFKQVTDEQVQKLKVKTDKLRMDSTQIASNIRNRNRLQLLVEILQRVVRIMSDEERERYKQQLEPYVQGSSGQYVYRMKPREQAERVLEVGQVMQQLVEDLRATHAHKKEYQLLERVFNEHFALDEGQLRAKAGQELSTGTLQSPDDTEATYRNLRLSKHKGYVANIAETCVDENAVQLIVSVQVEPNNRDDAVMLNEVLPDLEERTTLEELYTDSNYNSPDVDESLRESSASLVQTGLRGGRPDPERIGLEQFIWERDEKGWPEAITCPHGQRVTVSRRTEDYFRAAFDQVICDTCPHLDACHTRPLKTKPERALYIKKRAFFSALRKQASLALKATGLNPRAAVEAAVRSVKHPFRNGKLPVRGKPRMSMMIVSSVLMVNVRRIYCYQTEQRTQKRKKEKLCSSFGFLCRTAFSFFNALFSLSGSLKMVYS